MLWANLFSSSQPLSMSTLGICCYYWHLVVLSSCPLYWVFFHGHPLECFTFISCRDINLTIFFISRGVTFIPPQRRRMTSELLWERLQLGSALSLDTCSLTWTKYQKQKNVPYDPHVQSAEHYWDSFGSFLLKTSSTCPGFLGWCP